MRLADCRKLELGEIGLAEELCFRELQIELLQLGWCQLGAGIDELPARTLVEPLGIVTLASRGGSVCLNRPRAFLSGFPPWLRRHRFGCRLVEVGLIGGFPVKR